MNLETIAAPAAHQIDTATGAVASPIYLSPADERDGKHRGSEFPAAGSRSGISPVR